MFLEEPLRRQQIPGEAEGLPMAQQCLSVVFVRLRLQIWAQRRVFVVGGRKHVSGLHLIGQSWREHQFSVRVFFIFFIFFCRRAKRSAEDADEDCVYHISQFN